MIFANGNKGLIELEGSLLISLFLVFVIVLPRWGFDPPRRQAGSFVAWPWRPGGRSRPDPSEAAFALCAARLQKLVVNSRVYSIVYTAGGQPLFMAQNRHFFRQDTFLRYFHTTTQNFQPKLLCKNVTN